jgi:hypothetical protein
LSNRFSESLKAGDRNSALLVTGMTGAKSTERARNQFDPSALHFGGPNP